jgi:hypothetical protein
LKALYSVPISIKEARAFMQVYFGTPRIPNGSRCLWVAGCKWVTDQPGAYLIAGVGGMQGVIIYPPAVENAKEGAA